jgi:hypothetical protein
MSKLFKWAFILLLIACTEVDGPVVPNYLEFEEIDELVEPSVMEGIGMIGSSDQQHLFIAVRTTVPRTNVTSEKVIKLNTITGERKEQYNYQQDYITKQPQIIDDKLVVVGGMHITTYDQDLEDPPTVVRHGRRLSRFGSAVYENDIIVWGGDLDETHSDKILIWDEDKGEFDRIARMPGPKSWAEGAVVGGQLYIFGGQRQFLNTLPEDQVYQYDFFSGETKTFFLPDSTKRTYSASNGHLIYVAGQSIDNDLFTLDLDILFGAFDSRTEQFYPIRTNLSSDQLWTIHQMCIVGDHLYVLYGNEFQSTYHVKVMRAQLPQEE